MSVVNGKTAVGNPGTTWSFTCGTRSISSDVTNRSSGWIARRMSSDGPIVRNTTSAEACGEIILRDALQPLFADGWLVTDVDRNARTYTLSR